VTVAYASDLKFKALRETRNGAVCTIGNFYENLRDVGVAGQPFKGTARSSHLSFGTSVRTV